MADWQPITSAPKDMASGPFLVTNNLKARDAHGNMSHVWLVSMVHEKAGEFCAFKEHGYQKVEFLTHWMRLDLTARATPTAEGVA